MLLTFPGGAGQLWGGCGKADLRHSHTDGPQAGDSVQAEDPFSEQHQYSQALRTISILIWVAYTPPLGDCCPRLTRDIIAWRQTGFKVGSVTD